MCNSHFLWSFSVLPPFSLGYLGRVAGNWEATAFLHLEGETTKKETSGFCREKVCNGILLYLAVFVSWLLTHFLEHS